MVVLQKIDQDGLLSMKVEFSVRVKARPEDIDMTRERKGK
jgi:hypothetical protein